MVKKRKDLQRILRLLAIDGDKKSLYRICQVDYGMEKKQVDEYIKKFTFEKEVTTPPVILPTDEGLKELGWTLTLFLIKLDLTTAFRAEGGLIWIDKANRLKALTTYMNNEFDDFRIMSIGTAIGSIYDLVVIAYTKGIGRGFSEFAAKVTNLLPTTAVVTHPFITLEEFNPAPFGQFTVWNDVANDFDTYITKSHIPTLSNYMKQERLYLDKVIAEEPSRNVSLIEIGSGTGRLLRRYIQPSIIETEYRKNGSDLEVPNQISTKLKFVIGVERAEKMVLKTNENLTEAGLGETLGKKLFLFHARAELLHYYLSQDIISDQCDILRDSGLWKTNRIVASMLNTLGIMSPKVRRCALQEMKKLAGKEGKIVLSVFNGNKFSEGIEQIYSKLTRFVGDFIPEINIDYKKCIFTTGKGYYSHWFHEDEIKNLVKRAGLKILDFSRDPKSPALYLTASMKK